MSLTPEEEQNLSKAFRGGLPRSRIPTREQKLRYLQLIAEGLSSKMAARACGSTGTRFRALRNPDGYHYDQEFSEAYEIASEEGRPAYEERLRIELRERAFDRGDPASRDFLKMEVEALLPEYEHKRTRYTKLGQDSPFQIQAIFPTISQEALDAMPVEELEDLVARIKVLTGQPNLRAIEGGA